MFSLKFLHYNTANLIVSKFNYLQVKSWKKIKEFLSKVPGQWPSSNYLWIPSRLCKMVGILDNDSSSHVALDLAIPLHWMHWIHHRKLKRLLRRLFSFLSNHNSLCQPLNDPMLAAFLVLSSSSTSIRIAQTLFVTAVVCQGISHRTSLLLTAPRSSCSALNDDNKTRLWPRTTER